MKKKIETTIHPFLKGRTANVFLKKSCLIFLALLLIVSLAACGSKPTEVEVPEEVAEFFHYCQGEENAQILMDALVTDVEQTRAGEFTCTIEKYVAFQNAFMMFVKYSQEYDGTFVFLEICKGNYAENIDEAANKHLSGAGGWSIEGLEDNRAVILCTTNRQFDDGEEYSLVHKKDNKVIGVTSWRLDIKGESYNTVFPDFSSHGWMSVSPLGVAVDLYLVGDVSMEFPRINVLSEDKKVLATYELSASAYEQSEILGESLCHVYATPRNGIIGEAIYDLTGASEITIFDRSYKLEKVGQ
ncbi:MAG: hypothetical protein MJ092_03980 [Lachnospiraceae bacterium]|nr:hypothetical protein [Lachnospiraceae bacterium]